MKLLIDEKGNRYLLKGEKDLHSKFGVVKWQEKYKGKTEKELALKQHQDMVDALEAEGVECHFLEPIKGATEQKDTRDIGVISKEGAIAGHFKKNIRMGEVASFIKFCVENDITLLAYGIHFEGGDFFFVDETTSLVGIGKRTSMRPNEIETILKHKIDEIHLITSSGRYVQYSL